MCDKLHTNERIHALRLHLGMTRDEFALATKLRYNQITNIEHKKQKTPAWLIEHLTTIWPEYGYWLATGKTIPEAGQISPGIEEERKKLGRTRTAGQ
jgi:transcriptional regulator with XRE-family HTH domain